MMSRLPYLAGLLFALVLPASRGQLPQRSPFLPVEGEVATASATPTLEFSGYIEAADGVQFRVNDASRKTGAWLRLNEASPELNLIARQHDALQETLTVEQPGHALTLPLRRAKTINTGPATKTLGVASVATPMLTTANANLPSDLEKLAALVAERRATRAQAPVATPTPPVK